VKRIVFAVALGLIFLVVPARIASAQTAQEVIVPNGASGVDPVSVSGTSAIVGAPNASPPSVSFLSDSTGTWSVVQTITAPHVPGYGFSVSMSGSLAAVGAPNPSGKGGRVVIYSDASGNWKMAFTGKETNASFGYAVAASNGAVAVGDPGTKAKQPGEVYIYEDLGGTWTTSKLDRTDGGPKADAIQPTPNETGELSSLLNGVSCTSSTACTAVGSGFVSDGGSTLVEVWNGATWSIQASPSAHRSVESGLQSISCISATQCAAAGFEFAPRELSLIETGADPLEGRPSALVRSCCPSSRT
jgi:hypothetical protein